MGSDKASGFSERSATKRDMCVPLCSAGSATYILTVATVGCAPATLFTVIGRVMPLTPTRSMAIFRVSTVLCTSGRGCRQVAVVIRVFSL